MRLQIGIVEQKQLDIVLPAYNPKPGWLERVSEVVAQLQTLYAERGVQLRLVISPDRSWERAYPADVQRAIVALSESLFVAHQGGSIRSE